MVLPPPSGPPPPLKAKVEVEAEAEWVMEGGVRVLVTRRPNGGEEDEDDDGVQAGAITSVGGMEGMSEGEKELMLKQEQEEMAALRERAKGGGGRMKEPVTEVEERNKEGFQDSAFKPREPAAVSELESRPKSPKGKTLKSSSPKSPKRTLSSKSQKVPTRSPGKSPLRADRVLGPKSPKRSPGKSPLRNMTKLRLRGLNLDARTTEDGPDDDAWSNRPEEQKQAWGQKIERFSDLAKIKKRKEPTPQNSRRNSQASQPEREGGASPVLSLRNLVLGEKQEADDGMQFNPGDVVLVMKQCPQHGKKATVKKCVPMAGRQYVYVRFIELERASDQMTGMYATTELSLYSEQADKKINRLKFKHKAKKIFERTKKKTRAAVGATKPHAALFHRGVPQPVPVWTKGDFVRIIKAGSKNGQKAMVTNPDWEGRVQVRMLESENPNEIKSYMATELGHYIKVSMVWEKGDLVTILKEGSRKGQKAEVMNPDWEGRVRVKMAADGAIESYTADELEPHDEDGAGGGRKGGGGGVFDGVFRETLSGWMEKYTPPAKTRNMGQRWLQKAKAGSAAKKGAAPSTTSGSPLQQERAVANPVPSPLEPPQPATRRRSSLQEELPLRTPLYPPPVDAATLLNPKAAARKALARLSDPSMLECI
eukprot:g1058.t1